MEEKKIRRAFCLPPCPDYDVEGMESWLTDQASRGLHLAGIFAGVAFFEKGEPKQVRYRLAAAQGSTSMWADNYGDPDPEEVELSRRLEWEYVDKRGSFYIYRTQSPGARELNTDPAVQALALETVRKRHRGAILNGLFWLVYLLFMLRGALLLAVVAIGTWIMLAALGLLLWQLGDAAAAVIRLGRLQRQLREGRMPAQHKNWRRSALKYRVKTIVRPVLYAVLLGVLLLLWNASVLEEDRMLIADYTGVVPFATMSDLAGPSCTGYQAMLTGLRHGFNTVKEWSDVIAPRNLDWKENATITRAGGSVLSGGLNVYYHQMASPILARWAAWEYVFRDRIMASGYEPLELPDLGCDYAAAYVAVFPTVVLQKGNVILRATFYQTSEDTIPLEEWAAALAESLFDGNEQN